jgi:hypothetical protein
MLVSSYSSIERLIGKINANSELSDDDWKYVVLSMVVVKNGLSKLDLGAVRLTYEMIETAIQERSRMKLLIMLEKLETIAIHELQSTKCFVLPRQFHKYIDDIALLESLKDNRIAAVAYSDLIEAQQCIAFGRYTASVFHSLRVLDVSLGFLLALVEKYTQIELPNDTLDKTWGIILNRLSSEINRVRQQPKSQQDQVLLENMGSLVEYMTGIQIAKRDNTMHARGNYDDAIAIGVFERTCDFIRYLESKMD